MPMPVFRTFPRRAALMAASLALLLSTFAGPAAPHAAVDVTGLYAEALMAGDVAALDRLLAPNHLFIASSGHIQDKAHFLTTVRRGGLKVKGFTLSNVRESLIGTTRVVTGNGVFEAESDTPLPGGLMRFSLVIEKTQETPERIVLVQLTPVIPTGECPDGTCRIR